MCPLRASKPPRSKPSASDRTRHHNADFTLPLSPSPYRLIDGIVSTATVEPHGVIKTADSPRLEQLAAPVEPCLSHSACAAPDDPIDPEGHLRRCSGRNKKSKQRCNAAIGKKTQQNTHPTFLPTCSAHRDQQTLAGWCQFTLANGERCGRLFGWTPPYFELCHQHQGHPDTPTYLLKLPLELRHEIYRYLLPTRPIGSSTSPLHAGDVDLGAVHGPHVNPMASMSLDQMMATPCSPPLFENLFPLPFLDLILVNRQICEEAQDLLFSIATFIIDVRKDGAFMCGRRLLEPQRADGSSHLKPDVSAIMKRRFLKTFNWSAVKNYRVDILLENWGNAKSTQWPQDWDEEVEIYDIRDYVSVVVSGILAKSRNLCKLTVRLCLAAFQWSHTQTLANTKLVVGPFERLRNVRQPCLAGVYQGVPQHNMMLQVRRTSQPTWATAELYSVPTLPTSSNVLVRSMPCFDAYAAAWSRRISSTSPSPLTQKAPIKDMFTSFKDFYTKLVEFLPHSTQRRGRQAFLHRARVARELEDLVSFRLLRNELIQLWYMHLEYDELKKERMNERLGKMLDCDVYPCNEWRLDSGETSASASKRKSGNSSSSSSSSSSTCSATLLSPVTLDSATLAIDGIPMTANPPLQQQTQRQQIFPRAQQQQQQQHMYPQFPTYPHKQTQRHHSPHQSTCTTPLTPEFKGHLEAYHFAPSLYARIKREEEEDDKDDNDDNDNNDEGAGPSTKRQRVDSGCTGVGQGEAGWLNDSEERRSSSGTIAACGDGSVGPAGMRGGCGYGHGNEHGDVEMDKCERGHHLETSITVEARMGVSYIGKGKGRMVDA
ncbi:hypothetical protein J1614_007234 [Plenodomus biglobosus]|nr:hypothetical protein J1614_007234 [Plenodomus biglobosus]